MTRPAQVIIEEEQWKAEWDNFYALLKNWLERPTVAEGSPLRIEHALRMTKRLQGRLDGGYVGPISAM